MTNQPPENQDLLKNVLDESLDEILSFVTSPEFCKKSWNCVTIPVGKSKPGRKRGIVHVRRTCLNEENIFEIKFHRCKKKICNHEICKKPCSTQIETPVKDKEDAGLSKKTKQLTRTKSPSPTKLPKEKIAVGFSSVDIFTNTVQLQDEGTPTAAEASRHRRRSRSKSKDRARQKPSCVLYVYANGSKRKVSFQLNPEMEMFMARTIDKLEDFAGVTRNNVNRLPEKRATSGEVSDDSELNVKRTLRSFSREMKKSKKSSENIKHFPGSASLSKEAPRDSLHETQLEQESESSREISPKPLEKKYEKLPLSDEEDSKSPTAPETESFMIQNKRMTNEALSHQSISESETEHHQNRKYRQSENQRTSSSSKKAKSDASLSKEKLECSVMKGDKLQKEKSRSNIPVDLTCTTSLEMYPKQDNIKCCKSREEETTARHTKQSTEISSRDPRTSRVSKTDEILPEKSYKYPKTFTEINEQKVLDDGSPLRRDENQIKYNNSNCPGLFRKPETGDKTPSYENDSDNGLNVKEVSSKKRVSNVSKGIDNNFNEQNSSVRNDNKVWDSEKQNNLNEGNLSNKYNDLSREQKNTQLRRSKNSPKRESSYLSRSELEQGEHKYDKNADVQNTLVLGQTSEIPTSSQKSPSHYCACKQIEPPSEVVNKVMTSKNKSVNVGKHVDHVNERVSYVYSMENSCKPTMRAMSLEESTNANSNKNVEPSNESNLRSVEKNLAHYFFICEHGKEHLVTVTPTSSIFGGNPACEEGYKDLSGCCRSSQHKLECNHNFYKANDISVAPNEYDGKKEKPRPLIHPTIHSKIFDGCMYKSSTPTLKTEDNEHKVLQSPFCGHNQTLQSKILQSDNYHESKELGAIKTCQIVASGNENAFCEEPITVNKHCPFTHIKEHFSDGCKQTNRNLQSDQHLDKNTSCCNLKHHEGSEHRRTTSTGEPPVPGFNNRCITSNQKVYSKRYEKDEPEMSDFSSNQRRCSNCHKYKEKNRKFHNPILHQKFQNHEENHSLHSSWTNKGQYVREICSLLNPMQTSEITDEISLPQSKDISAMNNYSSLTKSKRTISSTDDISSSESEEQKHTHYDANKKDVSEISNSVFSGDSIGSSSLISKPRSSVNQADLCDSLQNRLIVPAKNVQKCYRTVALGTFSKSSFELNGERNNKDIDSCKSTRNNQRNFENNNQTFFISAENPTLKNTPSSKDHTEAWKKNYIKPLEEEIFQNEVSGPQQLEPQNTENVQRNGVMNYKGVEEHRPKKACCLPSVNFYVENARDISDVFQTCDTKTDLTGERTECLGSNRFLKLYDNSPFVGYVHSEAHSPFSSDSSYDCHYNKEKLIEHLVSKSTDSRQVNSLHRIHSRLRADEINLRNIKSSVNYTSEIKNQRESHESVVNSYKSTQLLENSGQGKFFEEHKDGLKANNSEVHVQMMRPEFADGYIQIKRRHEFHEKEAIQSFPELDLQICPHNCLNTPFQENNSLKNNSKSIQKYPFERQTFNCNLSDKKKNMPLNINSTNPVDVADLLQSIQKSRNDKNNSVYKNIINVAVVNKTNEDYDSENDFKYEIISPCGKTNQVKTFTSPKQDRVNRTCWNKHKLPTNNSHRNINNNHTSKDGLCIDELEGNKPPDILASSSSCLLLDNKSDGLQDSEINIKANERQKLQMNKFTDKISTNHSRSSSQTSIALFTSTDKGIRSPSVKKTQAKPYKMLKKCSFKSNEPNYDNIVLQFNKNNDFSDGMGNTFNKYKWESKKIEKSRFHTSSTNVTEFLNKTGSGMIYSKKANENDFRNEFKDVHKQKSTLDCRAMYKNKILSEKSDNKIFFSMRNKQCKSTYRFQDPLVDPQTGFKPSR